MRTRNLTSFAMRRRSTNIGPCFEVVIMSRRCHVMPRRCHVMPRHCLVMLLSPPKNYDSSNRSAFFHFRFRFSRQFRFSLRSAILRLLIDVDESHKAIGGRESLPHFASGGGEVGDFERKSASTGNAGEHFFAAGSTEPGEQSDETKETEA